MFTAVDAGQPAEVEVLDGGAIKGLPIADTSKLPSLIPNPATPTPYPLPSQPIQSSLSAPDLSATNAQPVPLPTLPVAPSAPDPAQLIGAIPAIDPTSIVDTGQTLPVSPAGQLLFSFRPGDGPGLHRVSVIVNGNQYILQFWQQDPSHPNNNPNLVRAY